MGITNGFANIAGFMVPWVVGLLTKENVRSFPFDLLLRKLLVYL